jgi:exosome complex component RRP4
MREFLCEGDVISAEVQQIFHDGALGLHTRSLKYGKLLHGTLVTVMSKLVKRSKNHFHELPCSVFVVLGTNGYIWIGVPPVVPDPAADEAAAAAEMAAAAAAPVPLDLRMRIARVRNAVLALAHEQVQIFDTTLVMAYDDSLQFDVKELLKPEIMAAVTARAAALNGGAVSA